MSLPRHHNWEENDDGPKDCARSPPAKRPRCSCRFEWAHSYNLAPPIFLGSLIILFFLSVQAGCGFTSFKCSFICYQNLEFTRNLVVHAVIASKPISPFFLANQLYILLDKFIICHCDYFLKEPIPLLAPFLLHTLTSDLQIRFTCNIPEGQSSKINFPHKIKKRW